MDDKFARTPREGIEIAAARPPESRPKGRGMFGLYGGLGEFTGMGGGVGVYDAAHRLYDPQVPDLVVTAALCAYGVDKKDGGKPGNLTNTLRFLPKVVLVSYKDLPKIYEDINKHKESMRGPANTTFVEMDYMVQQIGKIVDEAKALDK